MTPTDIDKVVNQIVTIYPNPTTVTFTLQFDATIKNLDSDLFSQNGDLLKHIKTSNTKASTINVSNLQSGVYILRIQADENLTVEKIIKL